MTLKTLDSVNPASGEILQSYPVHSSRDVERALDRASTSFRDWRRATLSDRVRRLESLAGVLRTQQLDLAMVMTLEMGKRIDEAEAEVAKCALACDYYAQNAEEFLADQAVASSASLSYLQCTPIGPVLAIMPWNFPFWQVIRFAAPTLTVGNTALLKHASNVSGCALALERIFSEAGYPQGAFQTLLVPGAAALGLVRDPRVTAVTLTGSEYAGSQVAAAAGAEIKKTVLELGGSDPFIVLSDADLDLAARTAVTARFLNCGQSCIAAKRFIVDTRVYDEFQERFGAGVAALRVGDPLDRDLDLGPMAREDLRSEVEGQVRSSVAQGARVIVGGARREGQGFYFEPTLLGEVDSQMAVGCQEVFGPVAALIRVDDTEEALRVANSSPYGLGASLWSADVDRARQLARRVESGQVFINAMVASDPRLPFGGVKKSGYGRELSRLGMLEFVNIQTVWVGPTG